MAKRLTKAAAEKALRQRGDALEEALRLLPDDVDPQLAARGALRLADTSPDTFARACRWLRAPVIRAVLEGLAGDRRYHAVLLKELVHPGREDAALEAEWKAAVQALLDLDTLAGWGTKAKKARFAALAADPSLLPAVQAVVGACEDVPQDMLGVLATDASEASVDALLPHFERAARGRGQDLDLVAALRVHARPSPALDALLARAEARRGERLQRSPALELARTLGLGALKAFRLEAKLLSVGPHFCAQLLVDSRQASWFSVGVYAVGREDGRVTSFTAEGLESDGLKLGACRPEELPAWLGRAARKLRRPWSHGMSFTATNVRGAKEEALLKWLWDGALKR
jgi:hypothetical protein